MALFEVGLLTYALAGLIILFLILIIALESTKPKKVYYDKELAVRLQEETAGKQSTDYARVERYLDLQARYSSLHARMQAMLERVDELELEQARNRQSLLFRAKALALENQVMELNAFKDTTESALHELKERIYQASPARTQLIDESIAEQRKTDESYLRNAIFGKS